MNTSKIDGRNSLAIIIPCYNCENTIETCLNSIGVHDNIRIIVVNDCSKDSTLRILNEYKSMNKQHKITILNNKYNMGPGKSRNVGIEAVREEYLMFLDADDVLDPGYFNVLNRLIVKSNYDCMVFRAKRKSHNHEYEFNMFLSNKINYGELGREAIALIKGCPWGKIYRTSVIKDNNVFFGDSYIAEDMVFTKIAIAKCNSICYVDKFLYCYNDTPGSLMNSKRKIDINEYQNSFNLVYNKLKRSEVASELNSIYFFEVLYEGTIACVSNGFKLVDCYSYFIEKSMFYSKTDKYYKLYCIKYKAVYIMAKCRLLWLLRLFKGRFI